MRLGRVEILWWGWGFWLHGWMETLGSSKGFCLGPLEIRIWKGKQ